MKRTILFLTCVLATITMSARYEADGIVSFTKGQRATIILPITPDADKGRYYRLDRVENYQIIFEEEPHPQARVPYIIIPNEDFSIDISALDLTGYRRDSTNIYGVSFIGTYVKDVIGYKDSYYYYTIDATSDCRNDMNRYNVYVGSLRAFLQVDWRKHNNQWEKMQFVIHDAGSEPKESHYYYYNGKKIPLTLNENKVIVSIPKECDSTSKRIRANVSVLSTIQDKVFDIFIIPRSDFERLTSQNFWEEDAKSVVLTSSYYTEGNKEVYETPYLNVKLKKEEDANLLDSYAEKYKLKNLGSFSQNLPLWYILHVTPDSDKSPLECANELYESGFFASSVPDFASDNVIELPYRQFVEEGKVWKVGIWSGNPVQMVEYFYFDGDTIVDGKACKWMWCQQYANEGSWCYNTLYRHEDPYKPLFRVGAFYEEDKKVYFQPWEDQLGGLYANDFWLLYDFSVMPGDTIFDYVMTAKASGGMPEFKGTYYDLTPYTEPKEYEEPLWNNRWLEGVGRADVPYYNLYNGETGHYTFLMSCTVGDEVIYLNDQIADGVTPGISEAKKRRFDFNHTIKTQPKAPGNRSEELGDVYGEYNDQQLNIGLGSLDEVYMVRITDKSGKTVYEKAINAGSIVALNIDISAYPEGQYTVTIENSKETFIGEFEINTTGIEETPSDTPSMGRGIYNLQGQRISVPQKGINIINGKKIIVK